MVEGEGRVPGRPASRAWPTAAIVAAAAVAVVFAWFLANQLERRFGFWQVFWLATLLLLAAIVVLAGLRNRPSEWGRPVAAAGGGLATGFVVILLIGVTAYEGCGLSPESATWRDPGMHQGLLLEGEHHGFPVTSVQPAGGFVFRDADLDARWTGYILANVAWGRGIGYDFGPVALVAEPGVVRAAYLDLADFRAHRSEAIGFLQGFGAAPDHAARIATAMEANASTDPAALQRWGYPTMVEFSASIPLDWTPRTAWESFCCIGQQPADGASHGSPLGVVDLRVGQWAFTFLLETKRLEGDGFRIATDAEGRVEFTGFPMGDEGAYKTKVRNTLKDLALPEPSRESMALSGSTC